MSIEYDMYAHVGGVDYQLCGREFEMRVELGFRVSLSSSTRPLVLNEDYLLSWTTLTHCLCTIVAPQTGCRFEAIEEGGEGKEETFVQPLRIASPKFDVVRSIVIHADDDAANLPRLTESIALLISQVLHSSKQSSQEFKSIGCVNRSEYLDYLGPDAISSNAEFRRER